MSELKFYLFGPPRLERNGVPLKLGRRKATALLAYVTFMRRSHSREALTTLFWPEYDRRRGRTDLSRTLSVLNKTLDWGYLVLDRETVAINQEAKLWVDVLHFQALLEACNSHGHPETEVEGEALGSRRTLWKILAALSEIEAHRGNLTEAESLLQQAREMVEYIAGRAPTPELRTSFLGLPQVRVVFESAAYDR